MFPDLNTIGKYAEISQALFTIIAIFVGGFWTWLLFVRGRQKYPRANLKHQITHKAIEKDKLLLHVTVSISNVGNVLLSLVSAEIRIQRILPLTRKYKELIDQEDNLVEEGQGEIQWPLIDLRELKFEEGQRELEPDETDEIHYDFMLNAKIQTVEIYSYIRNAKKRKREIGWNLTTIHDL